MATTLEFAFVMNVVPALIPPGTNPPDQFAGTRQRPLLELVQIAAP
jgi:hypothetical protein